MQREAPGLIDLFSRVDPSVSPVAVHSKRPPLASHTGSIGVLTSSIMSSINTTSFQKNCRRSYDLSMEFLEIFGGSATFS